MVKNKKGWIKIMEAFLAIALLIGLLFVIINSRNINLEKDERVLEAESNILTMIKLNSTFRNYFLTVSAPINSTNPSFSSLINSSLRSKTPSGYICELKVCLTNEECPVISDIKKSIYVKETLLISDKDTYSPRILKVYCY